MEKLLMVLISFLTGAAGAYGAFRYLGGEVKNFREWKDRVGPEIEVIKNKLGGLLEIKTEMRNGFAGVDKHMQAFFDMASAQRVELANKVGRNEFEANKNACGQRLADVIYRLDKRLEKMDESREQVRRDDDRRWRELTERLAGLKTLNDLLGRMDSGTVKKGLEFPVKTDSAGT
jgi:hypothetical protein